MTIRERTKTLVAKEKHYTAKIIKHLALINRKKLFCDYGYPTLFKYLVHELQYSEAEAYTRVSAVKLAARAPTTTAHIESGNLSLTNAAQINASLGQYEKEKRTKAPKALVNKMLSLTENKTTREAKRDLQRALNIKAPTKETLVLDERILGKIERAKKLYGSISSTYELIDILLEEKLHTPHAPLCPRNTAPKNSRYIPVAVKHAVHTGRCAHCGTRRNLQYDHIREYALGGTNDANNIQLLCENCNKRKDIVRRPRSMPLFSR